LIDLVQDSASPVRKAAAEALTRLPVQLVQRYTGLIEKQKLMEKIPGVLQAMHVLLDRIKATYTAPLAVEEQVRHALLVALGSWGGWG